MTDMPVFREPGQDPTFTHVTAAERGSTNPPEITETIVPLPSDTAELDTTAEESIATRPVGSQAEKRRSSRRFPVNTVTAHPKALAKAQELIAANPSYTKITPGDIPGSVIIR